MALSPSEIQALTLSLKVALVAVTCALPVAFALALLLTRSRFVGRAVINVLVHLPLVLPPVVVGYLLLLSFGANAPLGRFFADALGITFAFSWRGAALAAGIITLPFQVRAIRLALEAIEPRLEGAARTLGAGRLDAFVTITLPLALPGVVAGWITAFAAALGEFGAIITFVANIPGQTQTLPLAIYSAIQSPGGEAAAARLSIIAIAIALAGLLLAEWAAHALRRHTR